MNTFPSFTEEEKTLAEDIIVNNLRIISRDYPFLQKPVYALKLEADSELSSVCADYGKLYFNPVKVIELYKKNKSRTVELIVHCVLHCLLLHPSIVSEQNTLFDAAADAAVNCMMLRAGVLSAPGAFLGKAEKLERKVGSISAADLFSAAEKDIGIKQLVLSVASIKNDDHCMWYRKDEKQGDNNCGADNAGTEEASIKSNADSIPSPDCSHWSAMLSEAMEIARRSFNYGNMSGNMFESILKPNRFSKMSYREYIKRFALSEIVSEDPETIDPIMYNWGIENLDDIPIIEFSETKEYCSPSDIIIAVDMSGSCGGEVAVNFLRQLYTLFDEMEIRGSVNIKVVIFDARILDEFTIKNKRDADRLLAEYKGKGWGGTDFRCVFEYADRYSAENGGKKLKGLFFFSDAMGAFPSEKPAYKTTFFVPDYDSDRLYAYIDNEFVPEWVELVKYKD